ncbi:MAG: hypothetical protein QOG15_1152 [Solirubrobacteraceae bacterium]|nr:hypothetical protein [Solirubrobacteraceae bacterium]
MISTPVTVALVAADFGLLALLLGGVAHAARAERRDSSNPGGAVFVFAGLVIVAWFAAVFVLAHNGAFATNPDTRFPPLIGFAIIVPVVWGTVVLVALPGFRERMARIPLRWLVGVQFYRVVGALFLIAYLQDDIPAEFALPAGIGDVLVGLAAPFVALRLARHGPLKAGRSVLVWCAFGIADLIVAVTCGFLTAPSVFQQLALNAPNYAITRYPLVLIPVFAVPASFLLHIYVIARVAAILAASRNSESSSPRSPRPLTTT